MHFCGGHQMQRKMRQIQLRQKKGQKLGFSIRGGKEYGIGIFVSDVESGSQAQAQGLKLGDEIVRINGFSLDQSVHEEVKHLCQNSNIILTVRDAGIIPVQNHLGAAIRWKSIGKENAVVKKTSISDSIEMKLFIDLTDHQELGCTICKGPPEHPGIFVQSVKLNSVAYEIGIQTGDQIVQVNQFQFNKVEFQTAVKHLKASKQLELVLCKGAGRDFIPAESSGYNSSSSSVTEENAAEEQLRNNSLQMPSSTLTDNYHQLDKISSTPKEPEQASPTVREPDTKQHRRQSSSTTSRSDKDGDSLLEDRYEEEWVVEQIRKAAEDELDKDANRTVRKPQYRDQQVQTDLSPQSDTETSDMVRARNSQIWQRTVIAEVHNNPLPSPPPLPTEPASPPPAPRPPTPPTDSVVTTHRHSKTIPLKMAEEMQKRMNHDQLIEEFKQVQRAMRNVQNGQVNEAVQVEEYPKSPFSKNNESVSKVPKPIYGDDDDVDGIAKKKSPTTKIPVNHNNRHSIGDFGKVNVFGKELRSTKTENLNGADSGVVNRNHANGTTHVNDASNRNSTGNVNGMANLNGRSEEPKTNGMKPPTYYFSSTEQPKTPTRRGPLVTIGAYGDTHSRPAPNRFSFLNSNGDEKPSNTYQNQRSDKNYNTSYTTVIQNGPTKSTAVIETSSNVGKTAVSKRSPDIVRNKVTIKVPAANGVDRFDDKNADVKQKPRPFAQKHLTFEEVPIIIEDLPNRYIEVKDFNPRKLFTEGQIAGREIKMYSLPRANPLDIQIEGGLGTPLNGRVIVSRIAEGGEIYKHQFISKGDQLMWINGHSFLDITLSQAQGILRSTAKEKSKEPIKIILAKAHPGLYDEM